MSDLDDKIERLQTLLPDCVMEYRTANALRGVYILVAGRGFIWAFWPSAMTAKILSAYEGLAALSSEAQAYANLHEALGANVQEMSERLELVWISRAPKRSLQVRHDQTALTR